MKDVTKRIVHNLVSRQLGLPLKFRLACPGRRHSPGRGSGRHNFEPRLDIDLSDAEQSAEHRNPSLPGWVLASRVRAVVVAPGGGPGLSWHGVKRFFQVRSLSCWRVGNAVLRD